MTTQPSVQEVNMTTFKVFADRRHKNVWTEKQMEDELAKICEIAGYECEKLTEQADYEAIEVSKILRKEKGFVGTMGGLKRFLEKSPQDLKEGKFIYSSIKPDRRDDSGWIPLDWFKQIYNRTVNGEKLSTEFLQELENEGIDTQSL